MNYFSQKSWQICTDSFLVSGIGLDVLLFVLSVDFEDNSMNGLSTRELGAALQYDFR